MNKFLICGIGVCVIVLIIVVTDLPGFISATIFYADMDKERAIIKEIIDNRDCWGVNDLLDSGEIDSGTLEMIASGFSQHCKYSAEINDEGIDISDKYYRGSLYSVLTP